MFDEQKLEKCRTLQALGRMSDFTVQDLTELLDSLERLLAVKHAADPFVEFSHDQVYWQQHGEAAYETLKQALQNCHAPQRKPITKLEFLN